MLLNCTNLPDVPLYHVIGIVGQQVPIYLMSHYTSNMMKCVECMLPEAPMIPTENVTSLNENQSILGSSQTSAALTQFKPIPQSNIFFLFYIQKWFITEEQQSGSYRLCN